MSEHAIDELLAELLIIKDLYICGRMNQEICNTVFAKKSAAVKRTSNWDKYQDLSDAYVSDSITEILERRKSLLEEFAKLGDVSLDVIFNTIYDDFDDDLVNEMMSDFYGGKDTVAFAIAYNQYASDFNSIISDQLYKFKRTNESEVPDSFSPHMIDDFDTPGFDDPEDFYQ